MSDTNASVIYSNPILIWPGHVRYSWLAKGAQKNVNVWSFTKKILGPPFLKRQNRNAFFVLTNKPYLPVLSSVW